MSLPPQRSGDHAAARSRLADPAPNVAPELVAALLRKDPQEAPAKPFAHATVPHTVPRSFRAAILAGFVVAILNAAANATFATEAKSGMSLFAVTSNDATIIVALLLAALWSGARTSAVCLLFAHRLLAALGRSSQTAYILAGGGVMLALALLMQALGRPPGPGGLGLEVASGMVAGFFYRLFAGTVPEDVAAQK